jgi:hypothetical protein
MGEQVYQALVQLLLPMHLYCSASLLQQGSQFWKVVHVGTKEERFGKHGWLQRIVSSYGHQAPANKGDRTQAIQGGQFAHSIQDNDRGASEVNRPAICTLRTTHGPAVMGLHVTHYGFDPFQMAWGQHEEEVRVMHIQPTVDGQQQAFFALMRTAGDQKTSAYDQGRKRMHMVGLGSREQGPVNIGIASHLQTPGVHAKVLKATSSLF